MTDRKFHVAIIGGGPAGSAAALTLLQAGVGPVCIVESSDFSEPRIGETIPPDTNKLLYQLGVQSAFSAQQHLPCFGSRSLWGSRQLGYNDFLTSPFGHGWHLDRACFDRMLLEQAVVNGATLIAEKATAIEAVGGRITVVRVGADSIKARWFLDATGRDAMLSRACGVPRIVNDRQVVIWTRLRVTDRSLGNATWLEAVPYGWWYGAELPGDEAIVALGTDPQTAKSSGLYDIGVWATALSDTDLIAPQISRAKMIPESFRVTASHSYLTSKVLGANWVAVGDAASAFDPLSSAGIYKALANGQRAAKAISSTASGDAYQKQVEESYRDYLRMKAELYAAEVRWNDRPFWQNRLRPPN